MARAVWAFDIRSVVVLTEAHAREVIISGGSINSPQLLEMSGIWATRSAAEPWVLRFAMNFPASAETCEITLRLGPDGNSGQKITLSTIGVGDLD